MGQDLDQTVPFAKASRMFRARIMLPLELGFFSILLGVAFIGGAMDSGIHRMMVQLDQARAWDAATWSIGSFGLGCALVEWFCGEHWPDRFIRLASLARMWAAAAAIVAWGVLAHAIFFYADASKAQFPLVLGPICAFFHLWSGYSVRQVSVLLDPEKDTRPLEEKIASRRLAT